MNHYYLLTTDVNFEQIANDAKTEGLAEAAKYATALVGIMVIVYVIKAFTR